MFHQTFCLSETEVEIQFLEKQTNLNLNEILLMFCENLYHILLFTQGNQVFFFSCANFPLFSRSSNIPICEEKDDQYDEEQLPSEIDM